MILAVIQARLGSQRFPRKALANLNGQYVIQHVVKAVASMKNVDERVLAVPFGQAVDLAYCRNVYAPDVPEDDVLARFAATAEQWPEATEIVRVTGDCPMLQPHDCDRLIEKWRASGCEYGWIDTTTFAWPDGWDCEVFTRDLLMRAHREATDPSDREHCTPWMRRNATVYSLPPPAWHNIPKCSIDTEEDLERVRWMLEH